MAVFTVTASDAAKQPRRVHVGTNVVRSHLNSAMLPASFSASDIVLIAKVPNGALITDFYASGMVGGDGTVFKIGTLADDDAVGTVLTFSATAQLKRGEAATMPFRVSLSDDAVQWTYLFATRISGTGTSTCSLQFVTKYVMPGAD